MIVSADKLAHVNEQAKGGDMTGDESARMRGEFTRS
jgi:hypothetical protein